MSDGSTGFGIYRAQQPCTDFDGNSSRCAWGFRRDQEQKPLKKSSDGNDAVTTSMICSTQSTISDPNQCRFVLPKTPCSTPPSYNLPSNYDCLSHQQMRPPQTSETTTDVLSSKQSITKKNPTTITHAKTPSPQQPIRIVSEEDIHKPLWSYLGITLKRPDKDQSWGMSVSLFDNTYLVLGHVNHAVTKDSAVWSRIISSPPPARTVFYTHQNSNQFRSDLEQLSSVQNVTPCMLPGDVILSINGRSIPSFGSLSAVTQYLRESNEISMVVSRHRVASEEAIAVWYAQTNLTNQERMCLAAQKAYRIFRASLGVPCKVVRKRKRAQSASNTKKSLLPAFVASASSRASLPQKVVIPSTAARVKNSQIMHSQLNWTNPLFRDEKTGESLPYSDNGDFEWEDGLRAKKFIVPIRSFPHWLAQRKEIWRKSWKHIRQTPRQSPVPYAPFRWTNPLFRDEKTEQPLLYSDNDSFEWEDGLRSKYFIASIQPFPDWLTQRKTTWRKSWKAYKFDDNHINADDFSDENENESSLVAHNFWTTQGFPSFDLWLAASTTKWKRSYSWNKRKRKRIEQECEEIVHFPAEAQVLNDNAEAQLSKWLRVRKNQWRMMRRKRQRRRGEEEEVRALAGTENSQNSPATGAESHTSDPTHSTGLGGSSSVTGCIEHNKSPYKVAVLSHSADMLHIDALLEEQERQRKALDERPPFDISFMFDANLGAPDDAIAHCFSFLHRSEHGKLLCISKQTSDKIKERDYLWRTLCPPHWVLPRRPRKPWHQMYITRIREEEEASRKRSDELLYKAVSSLHKGDQLLKVRKLINDGQKKFGFDINYVSGVLFERNSLLNLAVINCRHKIVKWLIETKDADLESDDRGGFTPLLNAAWEGDKYMVRYLMGKGANRTQIGTGHYSRPLAPPDFKGLTAEGWARKRGHDDLASLIRLGL